MLNKIIKIVLILAVLGALFFGWRGWKTVKTIVKNSGDFSSSSPSLSRVSRLKAVDPQMAGIIEVGADLFWIEGYYADRPVVAGDLVYFRYQADQTPVVRIVRGVPGDRFEVVKDPAAGGWKIKVNEAFLKIGTADLVFGSPDFVPPLGLAEKSHRNLIGEGEVLLMTNSRSGRFDSTLMGLISTREIVGKIVLSEAEVETAIASPK